MALQYPTFINFKWYKTLWPELSLALLVQSPHLSSFPIFTPISNKFQGRHPNVQGPFYSTTSYLTHFTTSYLTSTQSFAAFLQSVSPPSAHGKNRFRTSCFLLFDSVSYLFGPKYIEARP